MKTHKASGRKGKVPVHDERLPPWPLCFKVGDGEFIVKGRVLTPLRMAFVEDYILQVLRKFWWLTFLILVSDIIMVHLRICSTLYFVPYMERMEAALVVLLLPALYAVEVLGRYPLITFLFGKTIEIRFQADKIWITGKKKPVDRGLDVSFATSSFGPSEKPVYQDSQYFEIVRSNLGGEMITEFFDLKKVSWFTDSCNFINRYSKYTQSLDIDPRTKQLSKR